MSPPGEDPGRRGSTAGQGSGEIGAAPSVPETSARSEL